MTESVDIAKYVLLENIKVKYGIFGFIKGSGYFPPLLFLNQFLMGGSDPCDQDGRMESWQPFSLSNEDYMKIKEWWVGVDPNAKEDALGTDCWEDWIQEILEP